MQATGLVTDVRRKAMISESDQKVSFQVTGLFPRNQSGIVHQKSFDYSLKEAVDSFEDIYTERERYLLNTDDALIEMFSK